MKTMQMLQRLKKALPENIEYWKDTEGYVYAETSDANKTRRVYCISKRDPELVSYLSHLAANGAGIADFDLHQLYQTIELWEKVVSREAPIKRPCLRVGADKDTIYVNTLNPEAPFIKITAAGWEISQNSPVKFLTPKNSLPMAVPSRDGDLTALRHVLNYGSEENLMFMAAWLIGSYHPTGPYVILGINGQQGSAKSSNSRFLRSLIDPNLNMLREPPKNEQDFRVVAKNNHVVALDNLSYIKNDFSDALCRLVYGEAIGGRRLYTDFDDAAFAAARPILLNGIPDLGERPDLADRLISVMLPKIDPSLRCSDTTVKSRFKEWEPVILGGLMDHLVMSMRHYYDIELKYKPRMVEFAQWVGGAFKGMNSWGLDTFLNAYSTNLADMARENAYNDEVVLAMHQAIADGQVLSGTSSELYQAICQYKPRTSENFPKTVRSWGNHLRRLEPILESAGIHLEREVIRKGDRTLRLIHISKLKS